jgi:hypothetical protein
MRDPLWQLKRLPWVPLLQNALLTVIVATLLDVGLVLILFLTFRAFPSGANVFLQGGLVQLLLRFLAAAGMGALAVLLMERRFRGVRLDAGVLWALVGCLAGVLLVKTWLPLPTLLIGLSYEQLVGLVLGLFSQGRRHWRW